MIVVGVALSLPCGFVRIRIMVGYCWVDGCLVLFVRIWIIGIEVFFESGFAGLWAIFRIGWPAP